MKSIKQIITALALAALLGGTAQAGLQVSSLGQDYTPDPGRVVIMQRKHDLSGNTSVRNIGTANLSWGKGGYYERSRDLGQVFTPEIDFRLDTIVLRTGNTEKAVLPGAPGAPVFIQFFEVSGEPVIDDCGTPPGTNAKHGYTKNHRADDFIQGVHYNTLRIVRGGVFPKIAPTCDAGMKASQDRSGRLCALRWDPTGADEQEFKAGHRYAFMVGFEAPAPLRTFTLANDNRAADPRPAQLGGPEDSYRGGWALRREGNGVCPPLMLPGAGEPAAGSAERARIIREAVFPAAEERYAIAPTTDGFPDVDTYRDLEFYIEAYPAVPVK